MDTMDAIFSRKSIRNFTGEKISAQDFEAILRSTDTSPVGRSLYDTLHITIVEKPELLKDIDEHAAKVFGQPAFHPLYEAPTLLVISATNSEGPVGNTQYSNAAILVHTITMAAVALGVGHCDIWGSIQVMHDGLKAQLDLPEGFEPCCGIVLGKTNETYEKREFPENRITKNYIK